MNRPPDHGPRRRPAARTRIAVVAAMAAALVVVFLASVPPAAAAGAGADGRAGSGVAVVDYDRVFKAMGWTTEIEKDLQSATDAVRGQLQEFSKEVGQAVNARKRAIAAEAGLDERQAADLTAGRDVERLPLTPAQRADLASTLQNASLVFQRGQALANQAVEQRRTQVFSTYRDSLKPAVRRVARANGASVVITAVDSVVYYDPDVDLTNKLIDELQAAPPPHSLPDVPKLQLPHFPAAGAGAAGAAGVDRPEPPAPATRPATQPAAAAAEAAGGKVFADPGPDARRVVYCCDASGSMISKMAALKNELTKTVGVLKPGQAFNLIFFQDGAPLTLSRAGPVPATAQNKRAGFKFLEDVTTTGTSDPIAGLRLAMKQKADVVYLLTDGDFPDNHAVLELVRKLNADKGVKIHTIAFVNDKDTDTDFIELLEKIAKENGGTFRKVAENELSE